MEEKNTLEKKAHLVFKMGHRITKKNYLPKGNKRKSTKIVVRKIPLLSFFRVMVKISSNPWGVVKIKQNAQVLRNPGLSA